MKVSIIVGGKFHAFNLAKEINDKHYLKQIITSYPKSYLKKYGDRMLEVHRHLLQNKLKNYKKTKKSDCRNS